VGAEGEYVPSASWPSDLTSGLTPNSTDKITLADLTGFLVLTRSLDTDPGNPRFTSRKDLIPGPGPLLHWINISDLTALLVSESGYPPMFGGARAFNGPACTGS
jgi:hypothetical protein